MLQRVLAVGLVAGLVAGLAVAVLQHFTTTPLILAAEVYEVEAEQQAGGLLMPANIILAHGGHGAGAAASGGEAGFDAGRTLLTGLATIVTAIGFALVVLAAMIAAGGRIDERRALGFAFAAFLAAGLAPALGLAPELPGSAAAPLMARQVWWLATAALTAGGLWLFVRHGAPWVRVLALAMITAPHVAGAPHPAAYESRVPAELAAQFAATSLAVQAVLWLLTGFLVGIVWQHLARRAGEA